MTYASDKARNRMINARQHFFSSQNLKQMIKARPRVASSNCESRWMNQSTHLNSKLGCRCL